MKDAQGRVWYTANLRPANLQPAWCKEGSTNKFAQYFPLARSGRNVSVYDPTTDKFTMIDTCFGTHHLQFGWDADDTLFFSGGGRGRTAGSSTKQFLATGDGQASQGWCPTVVDTNGDGKITKPWNEPRVGGGGDEEGGGEAAYPQLQSEARHAGRRRRLRHHREPDRSVGLGREAPRTRARCFA